MFPELALPALMGALIGVSAHRAGLCTVKAVAEIMTTRRAHVIFSFIKASLWVFSFLSIAAVFGVQTALSARPFEWIGVTGGLIFGFGAGLNGACSFSTFARLAEGHLTMLATLAGLFHGLLLMGKTTLSVHAPAQHIDIPQWLAVPGFLWISYEGARIARNLKRDGKRVFADGHWPLSIGVFVLAFAISGLLLMGRPWSFTSSAICATKVADIAPCAHPATLWEVTTVALFAMIASARIRGSFLVRPLHWKFATRHFIAGTLMGSGAAMMPGGNDGLILLGLPSLSPHALPDWLGIVTGIWVALFVLQKFGRKIPTIRCEADICRAKV